jgi:phenylalanyl-tRNA synthetase beta chain
MECPEENLIEIENPISLNYSVLRNKLLPSLLDFLSENTKRSFPQKIFEIGDVVIPNKKKENGCETEKRLGFATSHFDADFTEIKQILEAVFRAFGKELEFKEIDHPSFISGRCAKVILDGEELGIIGEIHPKILMNWGLEQPVAAFEVKICTST